MKKQTFLSFFSFQKPESGWVLYSIKWLVACVCIGMAAGTASAIFLASLDYVTVYRESHIQIIAFLPLAGLLIGFLYYYRGGHVEKGNHLLLEEIHTPQKTLPFIMAPFIYITTVVTHLFGGSAGREGTAVQMGASLADQFALLLRFGKEDRKLILITGIAAGFAAVFGTPLAGIIFGWEVVQLGRLKNKAIIPSILAAFLANRTCLFWGIHHTSYIVPVVPEISLSGVWFAVLAGICFGCTSRFFIWSSHLSTRLFKKVIPYPPFRPFIGGVLLILILTVLGTTKHVGLGIPVILDSFYHPQSNYDFAIKLGLTVLTLSSGFKGGEVTPLFFMGATLGSALSLILPLPVGLLAGMGLTAVFAGASNAPLACIVMSMELFGSAPGGYIAIACLFANFVSGKGIYHFHKKKNE